MAHFFARIAAVLSLLFANVAQAEGSLQGHLVSFYVLTYDDPARPLFLGKDQVVRVEDGIDFGLDREGAQNVWK